MKSTKAGKRGSVKAKKVKEFNKLRLDEKGMSRIECHECGKNARWISKDGKFFCDQCKKAQKKMKICSACGAVL